jgi:hypothetical protein
MFDRAYYSDASTITFAQSLGLVGKINPNQTKHPKDCGFASGSKIALFKYGYIVFSIIIKNFVSI